MDSSRPGLREGNARYSLLDWWQAGPRGGLTRTPGALWRLLSVPLLAFFALPLVALLFGATPGQLWESLGRTEVQQAIRLSLKTSAVATVLAVLFGTPLAYLLARRAFPLKRLIDTLVDLPLVLPPAVAGVALLMAFGRRGLAGSLLQEWDIHIAFTQAAVVLAQTFVAAPLFVRASVIGFAGIDPDLEDAAVLDGAGEWSLFRHVTAPLARKALLSGALLTWARALGEFGATLLFAGNFPGRTQTMPLAIYLGFELDLTTAITLSVILLAGSFLTLALVKFFLP